MGSTVAGVYAGRKDGPLVEARSELGAWLGLSALSAVYLPRGSAPLRFHTLKFLFSYRSR
jgi:hypothetical protein